MPSCSRAKNPKGQEIEFFEDSHVYKSTVDGQELVYTSATEFIHSFFKPFDADRIAPFVARKRGLTVEAVKKEWEQNRDQACVFGTRTHEVCEDVVLGREIRNTPGDSREALTFDSAKKIAGKLREQVEILGVEKIVFSPRLRIAGTIDLLARSRKTGRILILDWKTNNKIDSSNKYGEFGLDPIKNVPDCNYWHYALQLSLYESLLKTEGYIGMNEKVKRFIIHLTQAGHQFYELPDMRADIVKMLRSRLQSLGK